MFVVILDLVKIFGSNNCNLFACIEFTLMAKMGNKLVEHVFNDLIGISLLLFEPGDKSGLVVMLFALL